MWRTRLHQAACNEHWLHHCSGRTSARQTLQTEWSWTSLLCLILTSLTIFVAVAERLANDIDNEDLSVVRKILGALVTTSACYTSLLSSLLGLDHALCDIHGAEEDTP